MDEILLGIMLFAVICLGLFELWETIKKRGANGG